MRTDLQGAPWPDHQPVTYAERQLFMLTLFTPTELPVTLKPMSLYCWSNWREPTQTLENSCCEATVLTTIHWGVCVVHLGLNPVSPTIRNRACDISVTLVTWVMRTKHSSTIYSAMWCTKNKRCTLIIHYAFYCILTFFKVVFLTNIDLNIWSKWKRRFASGFLHVETKRWYKQSAPLLLLNISCISIFKIVSIHLSKLSLVGLLGHFYELENFYPSVHRTISLQCQEALQRSLLQGDHACSISQGSCWVETLEPHFNFSSGVP